MVKTKKIQNGKSELEVESFIWLDRTDDGLIGMLTMEAKKEKRKRKENNMHFSDGREPPGSCDD